MNVRHYELVEEANKFLKNYDMKLDIPIQFNQRLKKVLARYMFKKKNKVIIPQKIEVSIEFIKTHPKEHIMDVLRHELVHYALSLKGLPFDDGDEEFENELKKYGIKSTNSYQYLGDMHRYTCINCGNIFERKRKMVKTAYCGCSDGPNLRYDGIVKRELEIKKGEMVAFTGYTGK